MKWAIQSPITQWRQRRARPTSRGFTLIEILVVLLITGVLAGAASLTLLTRAQSTTLDDVVRRIAFLDSTARHTALRSGHVQRMAFNLEDGRITSQDVIPGDAQQSFGPDRESWTQHVRLPKGFRLDHAWIPDPASDAETLSAHFDEKVIEPDALGQTNGQITIPCSADGYTPTYALSVTGPRGERRWIVITGLTGQTCITQNENQLRSLLFLESRPIHSSVAAMTPLETGSNGE